MACPMTDAVESSVKEAAEWRHLAAELMLHSWDVRIIGVSQLWSHSCDFGAFMSFEVVKWEHGGYKTCCILMRAFKQEVNSCFQFIRDNKQEV